MRGARRTDDPMHAGLREESIVFAAGPLRIEGRYAPAGSGPGAVVTHPHPLMGGTMENNVVETLTATLRDQGYATLRFNFRGVGRSGGSHGGGIGEQEDVAAAIGYLRLKGVRDILLAGYSFGAWVNVQVLRRDPSLRPGILVSPPIGLMDFDFSGLAGRIALIVAGDRDPYCNPERLLGEARRIGAAIKLLRGVDHFFGGSEPELSACLAAHGPGHLGGIDVTGSG